MRDHRRLRAFELADALAVATYQETAAFPTTEQFGLTAQLRRAAVSVAANIVEGCARRTQAEYLRYLEVAYGSAREVDYHVSLAHRLGYLAPDRHESLRQLAEECCKVLTGLIRSLRPAGRP